MRSDGAARLPGLGLAPKVRSVEAHIGERARRAIRLAMTVAVAVLLAAPLLCGNAFGAWLRIVTPEAVHMCACGMKAGTCGCPACDLLEKQRVAEHAPKPFPVLRSQCNDDAEILPTGAVPPCTIASPAFVVAPSEPLVLVDPPPPLVHSRERLEPSKPPPRTSLA
jgi:hypothetical protein